MLIIKKENEINYELIKNNLEIEKQITIDNLNHDVNMMEKENELINDKKEIILEKQKIN